MPTKLISKLVYFLGWLIIESSLSHCMDTESTLINLNVDHTIGEKLPIFPLKILNGIGPRRCFMECQDAIKCLSINYDTTHFICELIGQRNSDIEPLISDGDFIYCKYFSRFFYAMFNFYSAYLKHIFLNFKKMCMS
jgi:hypothetical protein